MNEPAGRDALRQRAGLTSGPKHPRHPAEVTSDGLLDAVERRGGKFTGEEKDMTGTIRHALAEIAEGER